MAMHWSLWVTMLPQWSRVRWWRHRDDYTRRSDRRAALSLRRADVLEVIGTALAAKAAGPARTTFTTDTQESASTRQQTSTEVWPGKSLRNAPKHSPQHGKNTPTASTKTPTLKFLT